MRFSEGFEDFPFVVHVFLQIRVLALKLVDLGLLVRDDLLVLILLDYEDIAHLTAGRIIWHYGDCLILVAPRIQNNLGGTEH